MRRISVGERLLSVRFAVILIGLAAMVAVTGCGGEGSHDSSGAQVADAPVGTSSARIVGTILDLDETGQLRALHVDGIETVGQETYDTKITELTNVGDVFTNPDDGSHDDADPDQPQGTAITRSDGGIKLATFWLDAFHYIIAYSPHSGWAGPGVPNPTVHMNFSGWTTKRAYKTRDQGAQVTSFMNIHASVAKRCLYLYDSVSGKSQTTCVSTRNLSADVRAAVLAMVKSIVSPASLATLTTGAISVLIWLGLAFV